MGEMVESKRKARKANVKILNKKHIESERVRELRVITKGGAFIVNIHPTTLDPRKRVVIVNNQPIGVATSVNKIALLIEEYFKKVQGMEPIAIYPVYQHPLV